jgi:hypothetical protein
LAVPQALEHNKNSVGASPPFHALAGSFEYFVSQEAAKFDKKVLVLDFVTPTPLGTRWGEFLRSARVLSPGGDADGSEKLT